jgi:hypothetical protein
MHGTNIKFLNKVTSKTPQIIFLLLKIVVIKIIIIIVIIMRTDTAASNKATLTGDGDDSNPFVMIRFKNTCIFLKARSVKFTPLEIKYNPNQNNKGKAVSFVFVFTPDTWNCLQAAD